LKKDILNLIIDRSSQNESAEGRIAIIGGGFSGSLVAINLLQNATKPLRIQLIERSSEVGRGVAYGTQVDCHLLNVPAGNMSALIDQPDHFLNWLQRNGYEQVTASSFVPRRVYGNYVQALLQEAQKNASADVQLQQITDEAIAIETTTNEIKISLVSGQSLSVQKAVLAWGNFPPSLPKSLTNWENCDRYVKDAWSADAFCDLNSEDSLLLVGTGLTMVDVVVALHQKGFSGQIYAISRHGLIPKAHKLITSEPPFIDLETVPKSTRKLLHLVREEMRSIMTQGKDWRVAIDSLRPITQQLWQALSLPEQKRFLRHVKAYWEVHRHRIAEEIAEVLNTIRQSGQLIYYAGRIQSCREFKNQVAVTIRERGTQRDKALLVDRILNCTGSNCNYHQLQHPLLTNLKSQGLMLVHTLSLGIETAANGALIDANGNISELLYTLGTPRKGNLWETIAVPEIRVQAAYEAQELLKSLDIVGSLI